MNKLFFNVIKKRRFHEIPDWMILGVDVEMLVELYPTMSDIVDEHIDNSAVTYEYHQKNEELGDLYSFLSNVRDKNPVDVKKFLLAIEESGRHCVYTSTVCILMWLVRSGRECAKIAHYLLYKKGIDLSPYYFKQCCAIYNYRFDEMPVRFIDVFLECVNHWMAHGEGDHIIQCLFNVLGLDNEHQPAVEDAFHMATGGRFLDELIDVLRARSTKYYWGEHVFSLENIWAHEVPYLPKHTDMQYFVAYLWIMHNNPKIELSGRALDYIKQVMRDGSADQRDIVFKSINLFFVDDHKYPNANNIRFLMPFYDIPEYRSNIDVLIQHLLESGSFMPTCAKVPYQILRDFTYFLPKDMNNDAIQRRFLTQEYGDPSTLLSRLFTTGNTYIRTADGVCAAILYSNPYYLERLIRDNEVCGILINDIIGKISFSPIIEKLVPVVEKGVIKGANMNFDVIRMMINKHYPMVENANGVCIPLLRISPMSNVESSSIISRWTDAAFHISIYDQSTKDLMAAIKANCANGKYIPLFYGLSNDHSGIEDILKLTEIIQILKDNNAYFGDIKNPEVAELLFSHRFVWEN